MTYFNLCQDTRIPNGVLLTDINKIHGYFEYKNCNASELDGFFVSMVNPSPVNFYPDILDRQIFMVKDSIKDVIDLFIPDMDYKHCCLIDDPNNSFVQYYIPMLDITDEEVGIESNLPIFRVADNNKLVIVASLDFVEAVLRRQPVGCRINLLQS